MRVFVLSGCGERGEWTPVGDGKSVLNRRTGEIKQAAPIAKKTQQPDARKPGLNDASAKLTDVETQLGGTYRLHSSVAEEKVDGREPFYTVNWPGPRPEVNIFPDHTLTHSSNYGSKPPFNSIASSSGTGTLYADNRLRLSLSHIGEQTAVFSPDLSKGNGDFLTARFDLPFLGGFCKRKMFENLVELMPAEERWTMPTWEPLSQDEYDRVDNWRKAHAKE